MSTVPTPTLVDAKELVINLLLADAEVNALVFQRIYSTLPSQADYPLIRVAKSPGAGAVWPAHVQRPEVTVEVWAATPDEDSNCEKTAFDVAALAWRAIWGAPGAQDGCWVSKVEGITDPFDLPDKKTLRFRVIFEMRLTLNPTPA